LQRNNNNNNNHNYSYVGLVSIFIDFAMFEITWRDNYGETIFI